MTGPFAAGLAAEPDNLVLRAARGLADLAGIRASGALVLEKNLPVASGIGGGSADAAATLRLLCRFWGVAPELDGLARALGADVPVCLLGRPALMSGIGEILVPAPPLPQAGLVLVNPGVAVSTPAVFRARSGAVFSEVGQLSSPADGRMPSRLQPISRRAYEMIFEAPACSLAPVIGGCAGCVGSVPGLPVGADERVGRDLLRAVRVGRGRARGRRRDQACGMVGLGRGNRGVVAVPALREAAGRPITARTLGRRQAVRQRILIPSYGGSIPPAPAISVGQRGLGAVRRSSLIAASTFCQRSKPAVSPCCRLR